MNFNFSNSTTHTNHGGMIIRNGNQTIKMNRGGMVIENPVGQQIVLDNNGIHIYNRNNQIYINSNFSSGSINIRTNVRSNVNDFDTEDSTNEALSNSNSSESSSFEETSLLFSEENQTNGFNYRINSNNMMWHSSQRVNLPNININHTFHYSEPEAPQKTGLTRAQLNKLPVNLYNGKSKKCKNASETRSGKRSFEMYEASTNHSCAVCILDYQIGDRLRTLPCLHKFHKKCVDKWLVVKSECPICKRNLQN